VKEKMNIKEIVKMELQTTINKLKIIVSWANEDGQLVELDDDEIKALNSALRHLKEQSEKVEQYRKEIVELRGKAHLSCPNCYEDCMGWISDGEPCGKEW
jgi:hypothetical protein